MKRHEFDGSHWNPVKIRRARELCWVRENESKMIEEVRRRRVVDEKPHENQEKPTK